MLDADPKYDSAFRDRRQTNDRWNGFQSVVMDEEQRREEIKRLPKVLYNHMANNQR